MSQSTMAANRWKTLDYEPPPRGREVGDRDATGTVRAGSGGPDAPERFAASEPWSGALPAVVAQARGAYLLRNYPAAIDLLGPRLRSEPALPGGQRIFGQALARLERDTEARERLREAARQQPADWLARASLASLLLRSDGSADLPVGVRNGAERMTGCAATNADRKVDATASTPERTLSSLSEATEAAAHLEQAIATAPRPALRELLGASRWRAGQDALGAGSFREAGRLFGAAADEFQSAASGSRASAAALPARQSTSLVGQAAALLSAGELAAAQRLFSRQPIPGWAAADPLARFAAHLYEFCEELDRLRAPERPEAAAALREAVLEVRLVVGFYDGRQAVSLAWLAGPS